MQHHFLAQENKLTEYTYMAAPLIKAIVELQTMYGKFSQEKNMVFITRVFLTLVAGLLNLSFHSLSKTIQWLGHKFF